MLRVLRSFVESILLNLVAKIVLQHNPLLKRDFERHRRRPRAASDAARIDAGTKVAIGPNAWLVAGFDGEFSEPSQTDAGKGGVRVAW